MNHCVILHNNFEDVEALAFIDLLRRAKVRLDLYGVGGPSITSRSAVVYAVERIFKTESDIDVSAYDGILIPGGPGIYDLEKNKNLLAVIKKFFDMRKLVFAICAAPLLLDRAGILAGKKYTCYPGTEIHTGTHVDQSVVVDGNIITSQGVGTALAAGIALVERICGKAEAESQKKKILYKN
ncbi:MAG: DJ-1/PfpI family protein [Spirochaetaceae bacterium]|nr:MAG: DJ-1/PfpI family protein [Spirochaetaceae bacterium]